MLYYVMSCYISFSPSLSLSLSLERLGRYKESAFGHYLRHDKCYMRCGVLLSLSTLNLEYNRVAVLVLVVVGNVWV